MEESTSLMRKLCSNFSSDLYFAAPPISSLNTHERNLVQGVLHMLQGLSSSSFYWDDGSEGFCTKSGIYVAHLSLTSLHAILNQFTYASTCLKLVEKVVNKVEKFVRSPSPTLRAFSCAVSAWLKRLRDIALKEEENISNSRGGAAPTLLGLASSLSSLCSGAEFLLQIVQKAIPKGYLKLNSSVPAAEIAVHILDYLYKKLTEICLVQGGEEDAYRMVLYIFIGSLLPYIEGLDSWLFEGTLDDLFEEMFFYANKSITVRDADFWEQSYLFRTKQWQKLEFPSATNLVPSLKDVTGRESSSLSNSAKGIQQYNKDFIFPLFIKDIAHAVVSAGKSLQLIRHAPTVSSIKPGRRESSDRGSCGSSDNKNDLSKIFSGHRNDGLTLSEVFCVSLAGLIGHGDHISKYFWQDEPLNSKVVPSFLPSLEERKLEGGNCKNLPTVPRSEKVWYKLLIDTLCSNKEINLESVNKDERTKEENKAEVFVDDFPCLKSFCPENPVITVCQKSLHKNKKAWGALNLSKNIYLPPLNDDDLRNAIFGGNHVPDQGDGGTNYAFGFQCGESERLRSQADTNILEALFPFPTLLPSFQEKLHMSEFLPFQRNSTLPSRVLGWIQSVEPKITPLPVTIVQECLLIYIKKQVDYIGRNMLSKLLCEWRLMDELGVLRAIYLLGSGDLLQHFLTVTFEKLDKGESWEDDFELNMTLQESIANSADGTVLSAPDSLTVSITKDQGLGSGQTFGIDGLDSLTFSYKVPWPLELIANTEALKKYNQVMVFLLKVKRAKFVLDKARRWMWKGRGSVTINRKRHWLVEQKLLHFVDAFHQYVMDRVYHSAWRELCEGMATAASLDEVIEVHEAYLLLIQRQCFVVPDKLWALIASRINSILGLALDFYSIQQTLSSGAISTVKARCEMEVDRIEKQFDDCIALLIKILSTKLNVGHFPHLADLVTRINYNYYYMSDNGNLTTAPGGSKPAASKLGKTLNIRTNRAHNS